MSQYPRAELYPLCFSVAWLRVPSNQDVLTLELVTSHIFPLVYSTSVVLCKMVCASNKPLTVWPQMADDDHFSSEHLNLKVKVTFCYTGWRRERAQFEMIRKNEGNLQNFI
jgi:hypothetical protein